MTTEVRDRYWSKVQRGEGCWLWLAGLDRHGYGQYRSDDGRTRRAHHIGWEQINGPLTPGRELDHLCSTPACVRPDHLEEVTHAENLRRGKHKNRSKTVCKYGHPFDESNTYVFRTRDGRTLRQCKTCHLRFTRESYARRRKAVAA